jgi:hypothetical protein
MDGITPIRGLLAMLAVALLSAAAGASASGARQGVKAQPGEIVLLRDVAARPAYRMAPPGMALIADPKPQREIATALGAGTPANAMDELSDEDYAGMGAGTRLRPRPHWHHRRTGRPAGPGRHAGTQQ